jgi:isopenicillin-N epimerase
MIDTDTLKSQFLLDPSVTFLNHGSFGACPRPVFEHYQAWQRELEYQPVEFLGRRIDALLDDARAVLARYIGADRDDIVFVPNATTGVNLVARSLKLQSGDEMLTTDHEYGACQYAWQFACEKSGAHVARCEMPIPMTTADAFIDHLWANVTERTRVIFISHITSPTALIFPIYEICQRARSAGIITVIDGAHAPAHVPLDLSAVNADFYAGNCHKWMCAPKGAAFLYVHREHQSWMEPAVISWGWHDDGSFVAKQQKQGTRDYSAYLSVPAAIAFLHEHDWESVQGRCRALIRDARQQLSALFGLPPLAPPEWAAQMVTTRLPACDAKALKARLYDDYRIEVPVIDWNDGQYLRVSMQGYNTRQDIDRLLTALQETL